MIISQIQIQRKTEIQTDCFKGKEVRGGKTQIQIQNKSQHEEYKKIFIERRRPEEAKSQSQLKISITQKQIQKQVQHKYN